MEILEIASLAEFSPVKYVKTPLNNTKGLVRLLCFEPGQGVALHKHPKADEIFYVLNGKAELTVGEETAQIDAGRFVKAPADTFHGWKNGPEKLILISVLMPVLSYAYAEEAARMEFM
ncbi:MAG: cupin domain-containing protein [Candidatus Bathyarchaeota archaeon]|nr:cupin domain-containing protein [Candidatus Bathyarchaeota archaeon]MDH5787114.1 cupin domain-containing protein [Candidatus Bathyarchaeota archaeon]